LSIDESLLSACVPAAGIPCNPSSRPLATGWRAFSYDTHIPFQGIPQEEEALDERHRIRVFFFISKEIMYDQAVGPFFRNGGRARVFRRLGFCR
jgi:hypothetical protein